MASGPVSYALEDGVAVVRLDDGKANALSHAAIDGLLDALDRAEKDGAKALAVLGREERFSAGFDLTVMQQGADQMVALVRKGAELAIRTLEHPLPVVFGATGHALAMGAVWLCCADERIGADGRFKIGFNEVAIGLTLPYFLYRIADERLSRRHYQRATLLAEIYTPIEALDVGFLDRIVPADRVEQVALERARALGETLDAAAFRQSKLFVRKQLLADLRENLNKGVG